jgi:hypothetical protein
MAAVAERGVFRLPAAAKRIVFPGLEGLPGFPVPGHPFLVGDNLLDAQRRPAGDKIRPIFADDDTMLVNWLGWVTHDAILSDWHIVMQYSGDQERSIRSNFTTISRGEERRFSTSQPWQVRVNQKPQ